MPNALSRHLARANGVHIHWAEAGEGRPVVLLHGVCDSHRTWRRIAPSLSAMHRTIMPDLPGHGLSDRPDAPYTVEWYADVIAEWIEGLGLSRFDLVGHSFGGGVAQMLLLRLGPRVRRLALVAPGGLGREVSLGLRLFSVTELIDGLAQPLLSPSTRLAMLALLPDADPDEVDLLSWMNAMPGTARALARTLRSAIDWRGQKQLFFDRAHELAMLPPMAVYWGEQDTVVPIEHGVEMVARFDEVALTRFEACGHFPHQEHPEAFASALAQFLEAPHVAPARLRGAALAGPAPPWIVVWWRGLMMWIHRLIAWLALRLGHRRKRLARPPGRV